MNLKKTMGMFALLLVLGSIFLLLGEGALQYPIRQIDIDLDPYVDRFKTGEYNISIVNLSGTTVWSNPTTLSSTIELDAGQSYKLIHTCKYANSSTKNFNKTFDLVESTQVYRLTADC